MTKTIPGSVGPSYQAFRRPGAGRAFSERPRSAVPFCFSIRPRSLPTAACSRHRNPVEGCGNHCPRWCGHPAGGMRHRGVGQSSRAHRLRRNRRRTGHRVSRRRDARAGMGLTARQLLEGPWHPHQGGRGDPRRPEHQGRQGQAPLHAGADLRPAPALQTPRRLLGAPRWSPRRRTCCSAALSVRKG